MRKVLIIGLGNPEERYQNNRHNVGHLFVEYLRSKIKDQNETLNTKYEILNTNVFMNDSGRFAAEKVNFYKIKPEDLFVVHDDLDIPIGQWKIQLGVGPKVHNGVNSVEEALGTENFWRIRIGVDNRAQGTGHRVPGEQYVLQDFTKEEVKILEEEFPKILKELGNLA